MGRDMHGTTLWSLIDGHKDTSSSLLSNFHDLWQSLEDFIISHYPQKRWASYIVCTVYIIELITLICANAYHTPFGTLVSYFINIWHSFKPFSHYMMYRVGQIGEEKKNHCDVFHNLWVGACFIIYIKTHFLMHLWNTNMHVCLCIVSFLLASSPKVSVCWVSRLYNVASYFLTK